MCPASDVLTPMSTLVPMRPETYAAFAEAATAGYAQDNVIVGRWSPGEALDQARAELAQLLPQGLATPNHFICEIQDDSTFERVGMLWYAVVGTEASRSAYVYNIMVEPAFRRRGHARRAFLALEKLARTEGLMSIRLNVFAHNPSAHSLYRSLGYEVTSMGMRRELDGDGARSERP